VGNYLVCSTSGSTGEPGLRVHDRGALDVYGALAARIDAAWLTTPAQWLAMTRHRFRWASVVGTGGHYAGEGWMEFQRRESLWRRHAYRVFSVQQPLSELVAALNRFNPAVLTGYPSMLTILADEQDAGRLRVRPVIVELAGESMGAQARARVSASLGGALHDAYAASEFLVMAADCAHGWLHVNSDWSILEPVEADHSPTTPGRASHGVLLTNLANRVQPLIRYELGDSLLANPEPCPSGVRAWAAARSCRPARRRSGSGSSPGRARTPVRCGSGCRSNSPASWSTRDSATWSWSGPANHPSAPGEAASSARSSGGGGEQGPRGHAHRVGQAVQEPVA
jgi:phenylacetate-coenzyme A ligase PaaK-like adenylate-forming protein